MLNTGCVFHMMQYRGEGGWKPEQQEHMRKSGLSSPRWAAVKTGEHLAGRATES